MATNDRALHAIESARNNAPSPLARALSDLIPWGSKRLTTDEIITKTFENAMNVLSKETQHLTLEAEGNYQNLLNLEEKLAFLYELISREDITRSYEKAELLTELWTKLGGNQGKMRNFDSHLALLKELGSYTRQAIVHVNAALMTFKFASTLLTLYSINEDMEEMRKRVAAPNLLTLVEVHMKTIKMGLERQGEVIRNAGYNKPRDYEQR